MSDVLLKAYACGQCGGPLSVGEAELVIVCSYCGFNNKVSSMELELERFRNDVRSWLKDLGVVGHAGIDAGMRRLYFHDEIYPDLCTSLTNIVGDTDVILDYPLLYLSIYSRLPDLAIRGKWSVDVGKPMKEFSRKLENPQLMSFAPDAESQKLLLELKLQAIMIPMLMDVVDLSSDPLGKNLERCANTLTHLAEEVHTIVEVTSSESSMKDYSKFYEILERRLRLSAEGYLKFMGALDAREKIDKTWINNTIRELSELRASLKVLENVSVIDRVPMDYGLGNDVRSFLTWKNMILSYIKITERTFPEFVGAAKEFSLATFFHNQQVQRGIDLSWFFENIDSAKFTWFMDSLCAAIETENLKIVMPRGKSLVGEYLYPFYLLRVQTILRSGSLWWKRGEAEDFNVLCDGAFNLCSGFYRGDYPLLFTPVGKKIVGRSLKDTLDVLVSTQSRSAPSNMIVLPPTVSPHDAKLLFISAHNFREEAELAREQRMVVNIPRSYRQKGFDPGRVKAVSPEVLELLYIPMTIQDGHPEILAAEFEIETRLAHRMKLAQEFTSFLNVVK